MTNTLRRWERIARLEPYYAVFAQPQYLSAHASDSFGVFFESGEADVEYIVSLVRARDPHAAIQRVLDFGCGPGRLLPALSRRGFATTAVDVSSEMLKLAARNAEDRGATASFVQAGDFRSQDSTFDLIVLSHVLQHVDAEEGLETVRALAARLVTDGFLYLTVPFQTTRGALSRQFLALRKRSAALNAIVNRLRHRPSHVPVLPPVIYPLGRLVSALHESGCDVAHLDVQSENELLTARLLVQKTAVRHSAIRSSVAEPQPIEEVADASLITPEELIRSTTIEELNRHAEEYFAGGESWEMQFAKPFASPSESPAMLISLGVLFAGANLKPGAVVLEFGGGTGWLSRYLLQLGCRVILSDVSPTALELSRKFIEQHPPVGKANTDIRYLVFDGYKLDIEDAQVDRILCFDSFHHVPNVEQVLAEFARVLKPGGIAAFSEPGPRHSRSAQSQYEMRVYRVLENDVHVDRIWAFAKTVGFDDMRVATFSVDPSYLSLDEFASFLRGDPATDSPTRNLRAFTANVRTFLLHKQGVEVSDSRTAPGLRCLIDVQLDAAAQANVATPYTARVTNIGTAEWLPSNEPIGGVSLGAHLYRDGSLLDLDFLWADLGTDTIKPNEQIVVRGTIPPLPAGKHVIEFDCVAKSVTWFAQAGSTPLRVELVVA